MGFGEDEESVSQPTSSTSTFSFTTTTTSTRASPLSPVPSSESEQDCSERGKELSWLRTPRRGGRVHTYRCSRASSIWGVSLAGSSSSFWTTTGARLCLWTTVLTLGSCASCLSTLSSRWRSCTRATWFGTTVTTIPTLRTLMCQGRLSRFWSCSGIGRCHWWSQRYGPAHDPALRREVRGWNPINPSRPRYGTGMGNRFI